jgi:TetR/AcrR family transcriptional regulator, cholesterol catabolism regulator
MQQAAKTSGEIQRSDLLDAAAFLFATKGFHATSMRELAARLQIKAGSLYYHITSKEQLLNEVCEIGMQGVTANMEQADCGRNDFAATIRAIVLGHVDLISRYGNYLSCYQNEYVHLAPDIRERMRLELIAFHRRIDEMFRRAIDRGEAPADLIIKDARLALIAILHQLSRLGAEQARGKLLKAARGMSDILVYGLASGRPTKA